MKKVVNSLVLMSCLSLTACGGKQLGPTGAMTSSLAVSNPQPATLAQNPYAQPSFAYQAPEQAAPVPQAMAPAAPQRALPANSRLTPTIPVRQAAAPGRAPVAAARPVTKAPVAVAPRPAAPAAPAVDAGRDLINKARERFNQIQNFIVLGDATERNEKGETKIKLKLAYQKGSTCRLDIVQHSNSLFSGAKLMYTPGTDSVTGRPGGAMSFMKMTLPMSDDKVKTRRGYRLDQVDTNAIVTRLLGNPALNPKVLGKTNINGREIAVLEFVNANTFDQKITRELLGVDMQDHFVRIHEMYEGQNLVYSLKLTQVTLDGPITAADLTV